MCCTYDQIGCIRKHARSRGEEHLHRDIGRYGGIEWYQGIVVRGIEWYRCIDGISEYGILWYPMVY